MLNEVSTREFDQWQIREKGLENVLIQSSFLKERETIHTLMSFNNMMFKKKGTLDYDKCVKVMEEKLAEPFEVKNPKTIANCQKTVLAVSVKNREEFLRRTIPNWLLFPWKQIIIVDWSSDNPLMDWVYKDFPEAKDRILIARIDGQKKYRHAVCRNIKAGLVPNLDDFVMMADAEILFLDNLMGDFTIYPNQYWMCDLSIETAGVVGTALFTKRQMIENGLFPENTDGWGREDLLFYEKIFQSSYRRCHFNPRTIYHIPHGDDLRIKYTDYDSKWISNFRNSWNVNREYILEKRTYDIKLSDGRIITPDVDLFK